MKEKIWHSKPHMSGRESKYVQEAFETNWIAPLGPNVNGFEQDIANFLNKRKDMQVQTAALTSGTAALHLAMVMLGVGPGDIVMVQSFTFCGTTNPVVYQGAKIVFIDSELDTWNMCPKALEEAIIYHNNLHAKTLQLGEIKAIVPVHLYGMPAKLQEIQEISDKYAIPIIEDAAEALGSYYKRRACGTFGEMAALSFNGNKIITTSGGGALVSRHKQNIEQARFLSTQARDSAVHYQHSQIGYNYRMSNVVAGIGRGQMEVLEARVKQRRENNKRYRDFFQDIPGVTFQNEPNHDFFSNFWLTAILINPEITGFTREDVRLALEVENIEARPLWKPMHLQPVFHGSAFFGQGICVDLFEKGLCLPSGSNLSEDDFDRIFSVLHEMFK
ncbi:aminotransferase class I/II-fold pyridoxal phosphate-dependent enzyme [Belliella sp. R4-6]|uniref:Aminotransferase class I/II-fold pyridoxal phosphate-dependent enzyme n=1 Tax=Belliella alkalica TaxID=1730871 RepID=A0ABS9V6I9_9BACT|nr:aminotransferase class I/II-fold pyridoxal phosphate-dependent enzyme [Belliella alkalica]